MIENEIIKLIMNNEVKTLVLKETSGKYQWNEKFISRKLCFIFFILFVRTFLFYFNIF